MMKLKSHQSAFYYQTSLPHYRSIQFLHSALIRYKQWLSIKKLYPAEFFPPTYDIDVIWHAHQTNTEEYRSDTKALLGKLLMHDDSVNERFIGSKLEMGQVRTKPKDDLISYNMILIKAFIEKRWEYYYGTAALDKTFSGKKRGNSWNPNSNIPLDSFTKFWRAGGMFRGDHPNTSIAAYDTVECVVETDKWYQIMKTKHQQVYFDLKGSKFEETDEKTDYFGQIFRIGIDKSNFEIRVVHSLFLKDTYTVIQVFQNKGTVSINILY